MGVVFDGCDQLREHEAVSLAVGQFGWAAQEREGFAEAGGAEPAHDVGFIGGWECIGECLHDRAIAEGRQAVGSQDAG